MQWREKIKERSLNKFIKLKEWHEWFAWFPVKTDMFEKVWLEKVERKLNVGTYYPIIYYQYRKLNKPAH